MALVDSLLSAIVRADGDALVMHVGERPYVVVGTQTINISTHGLNLDAMTGMLTQLLPADAQTQLEEFGAVEYKIPQQGDERFSVVAARGGDDIWIEIRRRRAQPAVAAQPEPVAPPVAAAAEPAPAVAPPIAAVVPPAIAEPIPEPISTFAEATVDKPEPVAATPEPVVEPIPEPVAETAPEPMVEPMPVFARDIPVEAVAAAPLEEAPPVAEAAANVYDDWMAMAAPTTSTIETVETMPAIEAPTFAEAAVDKPIVEEPVAPEPIVVEPVREPIVAAPSLAQPVAEEVIAATPIAATPIAAEPIVAEPIVAEPIAAEPIAAEPIAVEPIPYPIVEQPSYATAYDPILSEVEEPEPYVIEDTAGIEETSAADFAASVAGDIAFAEAAAVAPIVEEPASTFAKASASAKATADKTVDQSIAASVEAPAVEATVSQPAIAASIELPSAAEAAAGKPPVELPTYAEAAAGTSRVEPAHVEAARVEMPAAAEATVSAPHTETQHVEAARVDMPAPAEATVGKPRIETPRVELPTSAEAAGKPGIDMPQSAMLQQEPGVVLPLTRTVRIEVPPRTGSSRASGVDRLLRIAAARGATALFLTSDSRPWIRVEGDVRYLDSETPLSRADVESAILEIAPESGQESIGKGEPTEWIAEFENVGRIRCTTFMDHRGPGVLLRMIATKAATAEQLGLAREVQALATESQGLVLVAGPRASGKSTLISALVDLVNRQRAEYVISLERQIRLVHDNKQALVSQREIRGGSDDSVIAARAALRESPDVLVVDDLVSSHMVPLLLTAAAEGLLVFVSMTAPSTAVAIERFVELAPPEMRKAVQSAMAESFRGAVAQVLLKKAGGGLVAAREVLLATAPVTRVIGEGQLGQLPLTLESGRKHGMVSFNDAILDFVRSGAVDVREAFRKAPDRDRLLESLKRNGIDTSAVERLA